MYNLTKCAQKRRAFYAHLHLSNYDYSAVVGPGHFSASYIKITESGVAEQLSRSSFLARSENPAQVYRFQDQHNRRLNQGHLQYVLHLKDMTPAFHNNLENGLSVPRQSLTFFQTMADKVFVPTSDQSRSGTGG